jgi:hypothetical protein
VDHLQDLLARFAPITLAEMDGVKLQDRVDTKYVFSEHLLPGLLQAMPGHYRLLEVDGQRGTAYRSLYLDTPDLAHYRDHHNRKPLRSKVRFREYLGSGQVFLEVKRKTGRGRTDKVRMPVDAIREALTPDQRDFVQRANGDHGPLVPTLWNRFTRYTFVRIDAPERLTLDMDMRFSGPDGEQDLGGVVVAELKQAGTDRRSPFAQLMRDRGVRPAGMSKYCIGMLLLGRTTRYNAFKPVLRLLQKLRTAA